MIRAVSVVYCISQRFFFKFLLSLLRFYPQKVRDNYGSEKTRYQSRLTASHQTEPLTPFYLLKCWRREDKLRNSPPLGPSRLSTQLLSVCGCLGRLQVVLYLMCLKLPCDQGERDVHVVHSLLQSLEELVSKHGKVGPFPVLHLTPPQITVARYWIVFFSPFPFHQFSQGLPF